MSGARPAHVTARAHFPLTSLDVCGLTGVGAVAVMQAEIPGLTARFTCMLEVRA